MLAVSGKRQLLLRYVQLTELFRFDPGTGGAQGRIAAANSQAIFKRVSMSWFLMLTDWQGCMCTGSGLKTHLTMRAIQANKSGYSRFFKTLPLQQLLCSNCLAC